ncbi:hypothetical protein PFICI_09433 [Pestalotiopsis fici W106-1]|uniref:F-box domain-containing protein n=1 Tax=Pestalotiopsis fici (strain W106-1 / CGMCC3.15140) TaxID=1229662 RepID=W3X0F6_PESFW|nr:uncharacterized protein PFICI_09433 [Pestalotiopsis fici W106-1]ETS79580.1 hypothetical protein PFICI_09433 [Pestalotiopsis fici W106-1]
MPKRKNAKLVPHDDGGQKQKSKLPPPVRLEAPPPMHHQVQALVAAAYPDKKRLTNAWDDRRGDLKRRRTDSLMSLPWELPGEGRLNQLGQKIESPHYTTQHLSGMVDNKLLLQERVSQWRNMISTTSKSENPKSGLGTFARVPTEVRDMILSYLLVHYNDIRVLNNWSLVYERSRPNLHVGILRVCRIFHRQGIRILYGENTFKYLVRDPSPMNPHTQLVIDHVYNSNHIPMEKHIHLVKKVKLVVEANRMHWYDIREAVPRALLMFVPGQLHTVAIELPAQTRESLGLDPDIGTNMDDVPVSDWLHGNTLVLKTLQQLNCQFIRMLALTYENESFEALIDRRSHFTQRGAGDGRSDMWSEDQLMLANRKMEATKSCARLGALWHWLRRLALEGTADDVGPFLQHVAEPEVSNHFQLESPAASNRRNPRRAQRLTSGWFNYNVGDIGRAESDDDYEDDGHNHDDDDDSIFVR